MDFSIQNSHREEDIPLIRYFLLWIVVRFFFERYLRRRGRSGG